MANTPITVGEVQDRAWRNKLTKGFNVADVPLEFCLLTAEVGEAIDAWRKDPASLGAELADVMIFLAGIAQMTGIDLEEEVTAKLAANEARSYRRLPNGTHVKTGGTQ